MRGEELVNDARKYLLEISWLVKRMVLSSFQIPVIDLVYELVLPKNSSVIALLTLYNSIYSLIYRAKHSTDELFSKC